ncbi:hypothetical protein BH23ACT9_BH23ACT9_14730 [soil metagenome]
MMDTPTPDATPLRQLRKRPVVDTGTAETIGRVDAVQIDPARSQVIGILVRGGDKGFVPLSQVQGIGRDAVTVPSASVLTEVEDALPRDTDAYGSRVLDEDGRDLGKLTDLVIAADGAVQQVVIDGTTHDRVLHGIGSYAVVVSRSR